MNSLFKRKMAKVDQGSVVRRSKRFDPEVGIEEQHLPSTQGSGKVFDNSLLLAGVFAFSLSFMFGVIGAGSYTLGTWHATGNSM